MVGACLRVIASTIRVELEILEYFQAALAKKRLQGITVESQVNQSQRGKLLHIELHTLIKAESKHYAYELVGYIFGDHGVFV